MAASGEDGKCRFYDPELSVVATVDSLPDADNVRYDRERKQIYVAYGSGGLAVIDAENRKNVADIPLAGHPESFQLESAGRRIFVNVPSARHVAVVDRQTQSLIATWPIAGASKNCPMALDEANHRLFITYKELGRVPSAPGVRTSLFVPETRTLYLAVPHRDKQAAEIWVFKTEAGSP